MIVGLAMGTNPFCGDRKSRKKKPKEAGDIIEVELYYLQFWEPGLQF